MTSKDPAESDGGQGGRSPLAYMGLGFELVAPAVLGVYGGYRLDLWLETQPWLLVTGFLLGIVVSSVSFFRRVRPPRSNRQSNGP